jgi:hypothetical protein
MTEHLSDDDLLAVIARAWQLLDPPPSDLADGVLARIAADDLEAELLTLVEGQDALAGVRSAAAVEERDEVGAWSLEYAGPDLRVFVRVTRVEGRNRLDGWVVPARPLTVRLATEPPRSIVQQTHVDEHGRFDFTDAAPGASRMTFLEEPRTIARPQVTPPFWI